MKLIVQKCGGGADRSADAYLAVPHDDPASSHILVSRIKPCKSQSKWINSGSADGLNQLQFMRERCLTASNRNNNGNSIC